RRERGLKRVERGRGFGKGRGSFSGRDSCLSIRKEGGGGTLSWWVWFGSWLGIPSQAVPAVGRRARAALLGPTLPDGGAPALALPQIFSCALLNQYPEPSPLW